MAYANLADVEKILPPDEEIPTDPSSREYMNLTTGLQEATDLIDGYLEVEFTGADLDDDEVPDDVPGPVRRVAARVAMRAFIDEPANPGAASEVNLMGPFSHTINWLKEASARDYYLTDSEKTRLERYRRGYTGYAGHVPMYGTCGTAWYG